MIYSEYKTYSFDYLLLLPRTHWKPFLRRSSDSFLAAEIFCHHSSFCQRRQNDCSQCSLTVCLISRANIRTSFTSQSRSRGSSAQSWTTSSGTRAPTPDRSERWTVITTYTTTSTTSISTITGMLERRMWFLVMCLGSSPKLKAGSPKPPARAGPNPTFWKFEKARPIPNATFYGFEQCEGAGSIG